MLLTCKYVIARRRSPWEIELRAERPYKSKDTYNLLSDVNKTSRDKGLKPLKIIEPLYKLLGSYLGIKVESFFFADV